MTLLFKIDWNAENDCSGLTQLIKSAGMCSLIQVKYEPCWLIP